MHKRAYDFIAEHAVPDSVNVFEIGSRNINGTARDHWPNATWTGIDLHEGPGVDIAADIFELIECEDWRINNILGSADFVVCAEVAEHCSRWRELANAAASLLKFGGKYIGTAAGPGRRAHSAIDGRHLRQGEYYQNIPAKSMLESLQSAGFRYAYAVEVVNDIQWLAIK